MNILRVVNSSGHTSAPFNQFTLARSRIYTDEKTTVLVYDKHELSLTKQKSKHNGRAVSDLVRSGRIKIIESKGSVLKFWKELRRWHKEARRSSDSAIVHIHHPKSGVLYHLIDKILPNDVSHIYTVHNNYANYTIGQRVCLFLNFYCSDHITHVSRDSHDSFEGTFIGPPRHKTSVIQNGVDVERIDGIIHNTPERERTVNEPLKIITIGRCITQKNQRFLLDVLEGLPGVWSMDIYGEGNLSAELQKEIERKGLLGKIDLKGVVPRDQVFKALYDSDIFLSPSLWEGLPIALMEAMCVGLPCIVSKIPSHREVWEGSEGLLLTELEVSAWRDQIQCLGGLSHEERNVLGRKNREVIEKYFSIGIMQKKYRELYESFA